MRLLSAIGLLSVGACARPAGTAAIINMGVAAAASGVSRAYGECYAACPTGNTCNPATGCCDTLPCHRRCSEDEHCDTRGLFDRCLGKEVVPTSPSVASRVRIRPRVPARTRMPAKTKSTSPAGSQSLKYIRAAISSGLGSPEALAATRIRVTWLGIWPAPPPRWARC
jgi:hypothetical protein